MSCDGTTSLGHPPTSSLTDGLVALSGGFSSQAAQTEDAGYVNPVNLSAPLPYTGWWAFHLNPHTDTVQLTITCAKAS